MKEINVNAGDEFGSWTILEEDSYLTSKSGKKIRRFICRCKCKTLKTVRLESLRRGKSKQCMSCASKLKKNLSKSLEKKKKQCTGCEEWKPFSHFDRLKSGMYELHSECKSCRAIRTQRDFIKAKNTTLLRKYGISLEDYNSILKEQGSSCAICKISISKIKRKYFCVDHNHVTGEVRGLLCTNCNTGLGLFKDNLKNLETAISYLEKKNVENKAASGSKDLLSQ